MKHLKRVSKWVKENKDTFKTFAFIIGILYFLGVGIIMNVIWLIRVF